MNTELQNAIEEVEAIRRFREAFGIDEVTVRLNWSYVILLLTAAKRADELERELDALKLRVAEVERERDEAIGLCNKLEAECLGYATQSQDLEKEHDSLRSALKEAAVALKDIAMCYAEAESQRIARKALSNPVTQECLKESR